ncbi:MAG: Rrf2 family transcriptional regulator [Clostridia bacterium]|nr:Rrf2 family transcriptional regulator [Clostridia bacterium]
MMISTRGRYALRVMIDLAQQHSGSFVPLRDIAQRQCISEKYLEAVIKSLVSEGLLSGMRGKGGGYKLTKSPEEYTIGSILRLTEGTLAPVSCLDCSGSEVECERSNNCLTLPLWKKLNFVVNDYLDSITLVDVIEGRIK